MPTVQLPPLSPPPLLRRSERNNRRRSRTASHHAASSSLSSSSEGADATHKPVLRSQTRSRKRRVSSIYASTPPISDRESSLYPHRVYASPVHDWSKSCNDLGLVSPGSSFFYPFGSINTGDTGAEAIYNNTVACLGTTTATTTAYNHTSSSYIDSRTRSCINLAPGPAHSQSGSVSLASPPYTGSRSSRWVEVDYPITETETDLELAEESSVSPRPSISTADFAFLYDFPAPPTSTALGLDRYPVTDKPAPKSTKWYKPLLRGLRLVTPKSPLSSMSSANNSTTPVVPPRSALRSAVTVKTTPPRPEVMERGSSLYPLGEPLAKTPSLSSGSDGDVFDDTTTHIPPGTTYRSPTLEEKERGFFGRKKVAVERDPLRIRDGRESRHSATGVYTPPTFPGACGPRPSHFPSHVYTPPNFQLYPTTNSNSSAGPSRSSSSSSSEVDVPQTPVSPTLRTFGNKTMAGLRRISGQIAAYSPTSIAPASARDSYFSYSSTTSRQSSLGPITPNSAHFPASAGLGVGLAERDGVTIVSPDQEMRVRAVSMGGDEIHQQLVKRPLETPKGKRKPVPEFDSERPEHDDEDEEELNARMGRAHVDISHAM